ncbi:MAG TPA: hypothetical protein V6D17_24120 [Candidatus Obscuribacterales bacterium]
MLDVRLPIGSLFLIIGIMLVMWGISHPVMTVLSSAAETYRFNLNLVWGTVILLFGALMLFLYWLENKARSKETVNEDKHDSKA